MLKYLPPVLAALLLLTAPAHSDLPVFSHPDRIHFDSQCLTIDGKDMFIYSGSFHYFRCPKDLWPARFQAIKDAGFNTVETYTAWNWHEQEMPDSLTDFSKFRNLQDIDDWLTMAEKYGLYVIIRPGPYICAEWDNGGFPRWMSELKKPATPLRKEGWLRSDDPVYLAWCKHWFDAVCPIIAKHQITRKAPGQPGVILFQIENEYDFCKMPDDARLNYLTALATDARANGIDVPLLTCWTKVMRGLKTGGPLKGVFDCTNFYPRLKIEHDVKPEVAKLRAKQPDALLATTELQGGWFAEVGGKLSYQQPGLSAAEIQNLTLYVWQLGDTMTNYYILFGGTNFDDWAGGKNITSYDYDAPIREDGNVGDRYQRVQMLGAMIREHGANLARAEAVEITSSATDTDVELAERKAKDGSRYLFVRTENNNVPRKGSATVKEKDGTTIAFDYQLEPFGSRVLYLPAGVTDAKQGEWLPKPVLPLQPVAAPQPVEITQAEMASADLPAKWQDLAPGAPVDSLGIYGSHFFYYKIAAQPGAKVTIQVPKGDAIIASGNGKNLKGATDKPGTHITYTLPSDGKDLVVLYENKGHPNFGPAMEQPFGIVSVQGATDGAPLEVAEKGEELENGNGKLLSNPTADYSPISRFETTTIANDAAPAPDAMLTWYVMHFDLPPWKPGASAPWHLHLEANGNGFIYVNGHCIGRYWQAGPQHDFYVPECWLRFGAAENGVALDLRPMEKGVSLQAASMVPDPSFAVETPLAAQ
jgi:hypothetical protein